ncbi:MAG TPA: hypothetical protein VHE35_12385 [Kofleriaceae bacterium]|nr:hypothetical protein [Kofleriaceae bacterium]
MRTGMPQSVHSHVDTVGHTVGHTVGRPLVLALAGLALAAGAARAEPVPVNGETWQHTQAVGTDTFTRDDGTSITIGKVATACGKVARTSPAPRYPWLSPAYWPQLDTAGGKVVLCLELPVDQGTATVTITPAPGKAVGPDVAPILQQMVDELRPAITLPSIGRLEPSLPAAQVVGDAITFLADDVAVGVGLEYVDHGTCAYDDALVLVKLGQVETTPFADGYWPMRVTGDKARYGCLDLRKGYLSVIVNGGDPDRLTDVLGEIRRAAYASHGAPLSTDVEPIVLPHTQQKVSARNGDVTWKVVDGDELKLPGADLFVSTSPLGGNSTMYAVSVSEQPCQPGTTEATPDVAGPLFPAETGKVWVDTTQYKLRWSAWTCVDHGGQTATITVLGAIAHEDPPEARDVGLLRPLVEAIERSYGLELSVYVPPYSNPGPRPYHHTSDAPRALGGGYLGIISLAPDDGDRRTGVMFGLDMRIAQRRALGFVYALDVELGYGGGELIGEVRTGGGLVLGGLEAVVGASLGSIGPGALGDVYGQVGTTLGLGRSKLWMGALHAVGVDGPDHDQLDAHLIIAGHDDTGLFLGARAIWFGDSTDDLSGAAVKNGTAVMFSFGGGVASSD